MKKWEEFELQCTDYLNDKFGTYAHFIHQGGTNSTVPDILVNTNSGNSFYIDVKHSPAQCGQFVLFPDLETQTFQYSQKNPTRMNQYTEIIMDYMNNNFDKFKDPSTAGINLDIIDGSNVFADWIIQTYKDKNTKFFITNDYVILPVEHLLDYFNVTAKYRIKRSGSSDIGKRGLNTVLEYINSHDYKINDSRIDGKKLFAKSSEQLNRSRFIIRGIEYMFSLRGEEYEIRKLSSTSNANVIFSITQKSSIPGISENDFIEHLK